MLSVILLLTRRPNVFAQTGDATSEQHKASAIERFFTCRHPPAVAGSELQTGSVGRGRTEAPSNHSPLPGRSEHSHPKCGPLPTPIRRLTRRERRNLG
jgi:hypothetical protein